MDTFGFVRHMDYGLDFFQFFKGNMAFDYVTFCHNLRRRWFIIANFADSTVAAGTKRAALGRFHCTGQIALEHNLSFGYFRIGYRHC